MKTEVDFIFQQLNVAGVAYNLSPSTSSKVS